MLTVIDLCISCVDDDDDDDNWLTLIDYTRFTNRIIITCIIIKTLILVTRDSAIR